MISAASVPPLHTWHHLPLRSLTQTHIQSCQGPPRGEEVCWYNYPCSCGEGETRAWTWPEQGPLFSPYFPRLQPTPAMATPSAQPTPTGSSLSHRQLPIGLSHRARRDRAGKAPGEGSGEGLRGTKVAALVPPFGHQHLLPTLRKGSRIDRAHVPTSLQLPFTIFISPTGKLRLVGMKDFPHDLRAGVAFPPSTAAYHPCKCNCHL